MKVHIEQDWRTNTAKVYVMEQDGIAGTVRVAKVVGDGLFQWREYKQGAVIDDGPTFEVPNQLLACLRDELNKLGPFSDSPVDWLRDSLQVRDRLLTLVEKVVNE